MVENGLVGVVVKIWEHKETFVYEVYVRSLNGIVEYKESLVRHFIYDKELSDEDLEFYKY